MVFTKTKKLTGVPKTIMDKTEKMLFSTETILSSFYYLDLIWN